MLSFNTFKIDLRSGISASDRVAVSTSVPSARSSKSTSGFSGSNESSASEGEALSSFSVLLSLISSLPASLLLLPVLLFPLLEEPPVGTVRPSSPFSGLPASFVVSVLPALSALSVSSVLVELFGLSEPSSSSSSALFDGRLFCASPSSSLLSFISAVSVWLLPSSLSLSLSLSADRITVPDCAVTDVV